MRLKALIKPSSIIKKSCLRGITAALAILGIIVLSGCSTSGSPIQYYQLPNSLRVDIDKPSQASNIIWVDTVQLAQQLSSVNVAFQTTDVNYTLAQNHLWASPLDQQLQFVLVDVLSKNLPNSWVTTAPQSQEAARVSVTVTQFHPRYDGKVVISGRFSIVRAGKVIAQPFELVAAQPTDGYDESIRQLALLWQQQSAEIASLIKE